MRPIPEFPGYFATRSGEIYSDRQPHLGRVVRISPFVNLRGYKVVNIMQGEKRRAVKVHALVLAAFAGPRPAGHQACHKNGTKIDNRIANLRWGTAKSNAADRVRHGMQRGGRPLARGGNLNKEIADEIRAAYRTGVTQRVLARRYRIAQSTVWNIVNDRFWRHVDV